jgi:ABC-type polysaccharide/polyol phosphate export permease
MKPDAGSLVRRFVLLRRTALALAVAASAAVAAVLGFAVSLFAQGYSGGSDPQSVAALAFPMAILVVIVAGLPAALVCAVAWVSYAAAARRSRQGWRGDAAQRRQ